MKKQSLISNLKKSLTALTVTLIASPSFGGGVTDGGGNAAGSPLLGKDQIRAMIAQSKAPTLYAFRTLEFVLERNSASPNTMRELEVIRKKLFTGNETVYQALDRARFAVRENGGCKDLSGVENDASALVSAPEICFSLDFLSKKLRAKSGQIEILALVVHEVSHLVGTTEPEADLIQMMIRGRITSATLTHLPKQVIEYRKRIEQVRENVQGTLDFVRTHRDARQSCMGMSATMTTASMVNDQNFALGREDLVLLAPSEASRLIGTVLKAMNATVGACYDLQSGHPQRVHAVFGDRQEMSLSEFSRILAKRDGHAGSMYPVPDMTIRRIDANSTTALIAELEDILSMLNQVIATLK